MKLTNIITNKIAPALRVAGRKIKKNSPEILLGTGIVSTIAGVVTACKATLKVNDIIEETNETIAKTEESVGKMTTDGEYTEEDRDADQDILKKQTIVKIAKAYAIPALLVVSGITLTLFSHHILKDRYLTLVKGYNDLMAAYNLYKAANPKEIEETPQEPTYVVDEIDKTEPICEIFDEKSEKFVDNNIMNASFLKSTLRYLNERYSTTHETILLNDVLDILKMPRTKLGAQVGWCPENGDEYISFGKYCDNFIEECANHEWDNISPTGVSLFFNCKGVVLNYL